MQFHSKFISLLLLALTLTLSLCQEVEIIIEDPLEGNIEDFTIENIENVSEGWPGVPDDYQSSNDFHLLPALQLGAQFVAAQAVADALFTNSDVTVTQVYSLVVIPPPVFEENEEENFSGPNQSNYVYHFDAELQSAAGETARAQFTVVVEEWTISYRVTSYAFDYLVNYENEISEVEVSFGYNNYEYNQYNWDSSVENSESGLDIENVVDVEGLPEFGESFNYDPNLLANNWVQINTADRLGNDDFIYLLKHGAEFVIEQAFFNENLIVPDPSQFQIVFIHSVYEKNSTGGTEFKFDIDTQSQEFQTVRMNFQLQYNAGGSSLNFYSWAIESIQNVSYDFS